MHTILKHLRIFSLKMNSLFDGQLKFILASKKILSLCSTPAYWEFVKKSLIHLHWRRPSQRPHFSFESHAVCRIVFANSSPFQNIFAVYHRAGTRISPILRSSPRIWCEFTQHYVRQHLRALPSSFGGTFITSCILRCHHYSWRVIIVIVWENSSGGQSLLFLVFAWSRWLQKPPS